MTSVLCWGDTDHSGTDNSKEEVTDRVSLGAPTRSARPIVMEQLKNNITEEMNAAGTAELESLIKELDILTKPEVKKVGEQKNGLTGSTTPDL